MKKETTTALATAPVNHGLGFSMSDIEIPKLNVIQKMSQIEGPVGSIVIDKDAVLLEAEDRVPVIIVGATKKFKEDIPYDSDVIPRIVSTDEEAKTLAEESAYPILEFAEVVLLIEQPEGGDESLYPYPIGEGNYQIARITVQKDAYRLTYKRLYTFQTFNPSVSVASRLWSFGTEMLTKGKYSWYVPTLNITKDEAPEAAVEFVNRITGN
jgi:hypothetical protein